jgi:hypothetical protein
VCQQLGVGVDGVGRPLLSPWCTLGLWTTGFYGGPIGGKCINIDTTRRKRLSFSWGHWILHGVGNIPVEASGSTQVGNFFSFSTSDLVYRSRHLLLAFPCLRTWPCIISYVFYYHHLDEIEEGLEKSERQKIKYLPQIQTFHVPAQMCSMYWK